mgnify:CR=1 FL=1
MYRMCWTRDDEMGSKHSEAGAGLGRSYVGYEIMDVIKDV